MRIRRKLLVTLLLGAAACEGPVEPVVSTEIIGYYQLVSVDGGAAPGFVAATEAKCTISFAEGLVSIHDFGLSPEFDFQFWRGLKCPGFSGTGYIYNQLAVGGTVTRRGSYLDIAVGITLEDTLHLRATVIPTGLRLTVPDSLFGTARGVTLEFGPRRDFPALVAPAGRP